MSRTSVSAGAGENRQYREPASEAIDFREQPGHSGETRFRRSASDPILGAAGASLLLSVRISRPAQAGRARKREKARKRRKGDQLYEVKG